MVLCYLTYTSFVRIKGKQKWLEVWAENRQFYCLGFESLERIS
jgi:hypothetical protein